MAKIDREEAGSRRRRKKDQKNLLPKFPKNKKKSRVTHLSIIVTVIVLIWAILPKKDCKGDISKTVPAVLGIRDQFDMGCTVYWY